MTIVTKPTRDDVDEILQSWARDPCFDLPIDAPEYAFHRNYMIAFRDQHLKKWTDAELARQTKICELYGVPFNEKFANQVGLLLTRIQELEEKVERLTWGKS